MNTEPKIFYKKLACLVCDECSEAQDRGPSITSIVYFKGRHP